MQAGELISGDVSQFTDRIMVNGVERSGKWNTSRRLAGDLPEQVVAGSGITQATGRITWAEGPDVTDRAANPWNSSAGWVPGKGERVVIYSGDGASEWVVFTGVIDETTGSLDSAMESSIVDDIDRLNVRFSHEPLCRIMPPLLPGDPDIGVGLTSLYFVDTALRTAGFYATPAVEPRSIVSVPAQTSLWPETGTMTKGIVQGDPWASYYDAPFGVSMGDFEADYSPALQYPMTEPAQFTMLVAPDHAETASFFAHYGIDTLNFSVSGTRTATVQLAGVTVCSLALGTATTVVLSFSGGVFTLKTNGGTATGTATYPNADPLTKVTLKAGVNSRVAGFQASHYDSSSNFQSLNHVPSANYRMDTFLHTGLMDAAPTIRPTTVRALLEEISAATLTGMWIDELGVFQWAPSVNLRDQASTQTVTTLDDIRSLSWQDSLLSVRSNVDVDNRVPAITVHRWDNVLWYQGGGESLESGEQLTTFIEPDADTDWIRISSELSVIGSTGGGTAANRGRGSVTGAILVDGDTEGGFTDGLTATLEQITPGTLKMVHTAGTLLAGQHLVLKYPSEVASVAYRWWGAPFPIIRGFGKVEWTDATYTSSITGPSWAPVLVHDAGPWNARMDEDFVIVRIADYLAEQTTKPQPVITGMRVGFDPRRQLGDVITISSPKMMGVTLTALIVGIDNASDGSFTQSLDVRIISAATTFTTYAQYSKELAGASLTYQQWQALGPVPQTFEQFNDAA